MSRTTDFTIATKEFQAMFAALCTCMGAVAAVLVPIPYPPVDSQGKENLRDKGKEEINRK